MLQNNKEVDPDFEPETPVDPDFEPEPVNTESAEPGLMGTVKGIAEKVGEAANISNAVFSNTLTGAIVEPVNVISGYINGLFDKGGDYTAESLAYHGANPYLSAAAGTVVAKAPDIIFTAQGLSAIKAAGNARAESEMLNGIMKKANPLALEYKPSLGPIEAPKSIIESGPAIPLESNSTKLLKGSKPLALPEPNVKYGPDINPEFNKDIFYHVSPQENAESIMKQGLKANKYGEEKFERVYLFHERQPADEWFGTEGNKVFKITADKKIQDNIQLDEQGYHFIHRGDIPPSAIKPVSEFEMRDKPDLAKLQQADIMSGQPKYPEDIGRYSMRGYAARKKLSADVPDFRTIPDTVAPADRYNPAVSELVDESRRQYVGVDPRLEIVKDMETGRTTFRLKRDPQLEKRVVTEVEHASNTGTKNSAAVKEMGLDSRIVDSSSVLPGSETIPVLKEGVVAGSSNWAQSFWNRIGVAAEDAISRMGDAGKQMANGIRTVRDVPQVRYGEFSAGFDKFLKGTSKKQAKEISIALSDALEGRTPKTKVPEGMLEFVQQKLKVIADEAEAIGLQVRNSNGEVVPFAARENYFPRVLRQEIFDGLISGDDKVMRDIAQKMVANKQQPNFQMAFERVKYMRNKMMTNKYGHLERAREVELSPELYDRNSLRVIPEYINSALHRIEEVRQFGLEGERALEMLNMMQQQGHDAKLARTIFERFTRIEPRDNVYLRGAQGLRNITAGMLIQAQSTALQLGQAMMPAYEAGVFNAIKGFAKSFTELGAAEAKRAGQVFNIAAEEYMKEAYGSGSYGFGSKFVDGVFKMTGFTRMDHFLRKYAALTGKEYIPSLVKKLVNNPASKTARVELQNLGYDTGKILRNKGISVEELNVGAKRFADMTQGAPDVTRLPEFWTRPEGKLFGQFKNFSYLIGKQNVSMIKRALQTGNVARLGEMAVGLPMTGYVISELRKAMVGESQYEITGNEEVDQVIEILGNATAFGPSMDLFFQALQGPQNLKNFLLPTSISNALEIAGAAGKALKTGETEDLQKTLLKKTPVVGKVLANQVYGE